MKMHSLFIIFATIGLLTVQCSSKNKVQAPERHNELPADSQGQLKSASDSNEMAIDEEPAQAQKVEAIKKNVKDQKKKSKVKKKTKAKKKSKEVKK